MDGKALLSFSSSKFSSFPWGRADEGAGAELVEGWLYGCRITRLQLVCHHLLLRGLACVYSFIFLTVRVALCTVHICWRPDL